ncbi:MAG TPA: fibronectin type III domain-containing protein [Candidatus Nitrosotalea sp.]|nr:fibronectin type III domain-containing protein [Candidatus Nitrosotalea sp.]
MDKQGLYLGVLLSIIVVSLTVIPVYAEVTSLKTNAPFYKGGSKIYFSGTILDTDPPNVTLLLFDPTDKFISLASGMADSNHTFQIIVDTSTSDNQQKFSIKGTYNATAFIATKENGKTVAFTFSPDGSPVISSPPTSLTTSVASSTEIDLQWSSPTNTGGGQLSGYKIERDDGTGFNFIQNTLSTSYQDTGLTPNKLYSYRVSAVNQAGTSNPSNVATAVTFSPPSTTTPPPTTDQSQTSVDDLIKKRIEDAKRLQDLINSKNSGSPSTTNSKVIQLSEKMAVDDVASNPGVQKSNALGNAMPGLGDFSTVIYPIISLVGAGIVGSILYLRKKRNQSDSSTEMIKEIPVPEVSSEQKDDGDHAMTILKNRLAKGEITVDQFKELKEELSEP